MSKQKAGGNHPHNGRNGEVVPRSTKPRVEPPDNRESKEAVGFGRPPVAYRFRPGQSGNPGGRPKNLPVTGRYAEMVEAHLPPSLRRQLEQEIGMKLPKKFLWADAIAMKMCLAAMNSPKAAQEIREAIEGKATERIIPPEPPVQRDEDALRKHILGRLIENMHKRSKLFNIQIQYLDQMVADAGVRREDFEKAMDDKKPSPPEAAIGDEES